MTQEKPVTTEDIQEMIYMAEQNISELADLADSEEAEQEANRLSSLLDRTTPIMLAAPKLLAAIQGLVNTRDETALADDPAYYRIDQAIETARKLIHDLTA